MQHRPADRSATRDDRAVTSHDGAGPAGWWGWRWEPPVPMSVTELIAAHDMDARTAALCWLVLEGHGSLLVAAERPRAGKTTLLTALCDLLPETIDRVFLRGGTDAPDDVALALAAPARTLLLANELSSHLPVYLWGEPAVRAFRALREGFALGSTLHAGSAAEAIARLRDELGVAADDLARVDLLLVMRLDDADGRAVRRVASVHRLAPGREGPRAIPLVAHDRRSDLWAHDPAAEAALVAARHELTPAAAERELAARAARLADLAGKATFTMSDVRRALGSPAPFFEGDRP